MMREREIDGIPIIGCSAEDDKEEECTGAGMDMLIGKPPRDGRLEALIKQYLVDS